MIRALFDLSRWPALLVLFAAGLFVVGFSFASINLFEYGMANLRFVKSYGLEAIREGAFLQMAQLGGAGAIALLCYLGFKFCEVDLSIRYRRWIDASKTAQDTTTEAE